MSVYEEVPGNAPDMLEIAGVEEYVMLVGDPEFVNCGGASRKFGTKAAAGISSISLSESLVKKRGECGMEL